VIRPRLEQTAADTPLLSIPTVSSMYSIPSLSWQIKLVVTENDAFPHRAVDNLITIRCHPNDLRRVGLPAVVGSEETLSKPPLFFSDSLCLSRGSVLVN
jgi:hypothetical protein